MQYRLVEFLVLNRALVQYYLDCAFTQLPPIYVKALAMLLNKINDNYKLENSWQLVPKAVAEMSPEHFQDFVNEITIMWQAISADE